MKTRVEKLWFPLPRCVFLRFAAPAGPGAGLRRRRAWTRLEQVRKRGTWHLAKSLVRRREHGERAGALKRVNELASLDGSHERGEVRGSDSELDDVHGRSRWGAEARRHVGEAHCREQDRFVHDLNGLVVFDL